MPNEVLSPQIAVGERGASQLAVRQRMARDDFKFALLTEKGDTKKKNGEEKEGSF